MGVNLRHMASVSAILVGELKRWYDEKKDFALIDVMPKEVFLQEHLPGARSACVYAVTFLDQVNALVPEKDKTVVLYGRTIDSKASAEAGRKLADAGWEKVFDLREGLTGWKIAGFPTEGSGVPIQAPKAEDRAYQVDLAQSQIEWIGRNLASQRTGTLKLAFGEITIKNGRIAGGHFGMDLNSIENTDLAEQNLKQMLVRHLLSDDFFDASRFPECRFNIMQVDEISDATPGKNNVVIYGTLLLKGMERPFDFPACVGLTAEGHFVAQAHFDLDRTHWNVLYGSGKIFEHLAMHLVNDLVSLQLKIVAK